MVCQQMTTCAFNATLPSILKLEPNLTSLLFEGLTAEILLFTQKLSFYSSPTTDTIAVVAPEVRGEATLIEIAIEVLACPSTHLLRPP
jgi:hypothetical protein